MSQRLCVITAMRDCAPLVPVFTRMIEDFAVEPTRVVIGLNDCTDATEMLLREWNHPGLDLFTFTTGKPPFARDASGSLTELLAHACARCGHLAAVRNRVIERALTHPDWDIA